MSKTYIAVSLRRLVIKKANNQCEYCLISATLSFFPHELDHAIAEKHGGQTTLENLAWQPDKSEENKEGQEVQFKERIRENQM